MERPKSLQNFIKNSGVSVRRVSPPSFPRRLQNSTINNQNLGNFAEFLNMNNSNSNNNSYNNFSSNNSNNNSNSNNI